MRLLLIHQNFPGQFRQLAPYLQKKGHELVAICSHQRPTGVNCRTLRYCEPPRRDDLPQGSSLAHDHLQRAADVARLCAQLDHEGWRPDCIAVHTGWGESLALREVWSDVPQVLWPELWVLPEHGGHGHDPLLPPADLNKQLDQLARNTFTRAALAQAEAWVMPTRHQAASLPISLQDDRLHVIHEGISTQRACPNPEVKYTVAGHAIDRSVPTVTFVNRNLERLRGFDQFMRALPPVLRAYPRLRVLIVGDNERGYGGGHPSGRPLKEVMLEELRGSLDCSRIHFLGRIPHDHLIGILQASWVHVYLSYPFVMGWSLLEAMACGCSIVASRGMPVEEAITDGVEGLLVPMQDPQLLSQRILALLSDPGLRRGFSERARARALDWDQQRMLPRLEAVLAATAAGGAQPRS